MCWHQATVGDEDMGFLGFLDRGAFILLTHKEVDLFLSRCSVCVCVCLCVCVRAHMRAKSLQLYPTLCDPIDCVPPGSSTYGIFKQEYWSGLPCPPPPGDLPHPGTESESLSLLHWQAGSLPLVPPGKPKA